MLKGRLPWYLGGLLLGTTFFVAIYLITSVGVSTQYVVAEGLIWKQVDATIIEKKESSEGTTGYCSKNAYLNRYANKIGDPLNYGFVFVIAMFVGSFLSALLKGDTPHGKTQRTMPDVWRQRFGSKPVKRYLSTFTGGTLVLIAARLAGGCSSGNMMSGTMQSALSGYLFTVAVFSMAIPTALILYKRKNNS